MKNKKLLIFMLLVIATIVTILLISNENVYAAELTPTADQYLELKLADTKAVDGAGTQATFELWVYNLNFKGFDMRFSYDSTKLTPSNISTNIATTGTDCFAFENGFGGFMDIFKVDESETNILRYVVSLNPIMDGDGNVSYESTNSYLILDETNGDYINSTDGVLIGKITFILTEGAELDDTTFSLVTSTTDSPLTGIKIAETASDYYSDQSIVKFSMITTGTVEGIVVTPPTLNTTAKNIASILVYDSTDVSIDWETVIAALEADSGTDTVNATLKALTPVYEGTTNDDGTFSIELTEGSYVLLIDKPGYLDSIFKEVNITKNETKTLEQVSLIPGDTDKNGVVNNNDAVKLYQSNGIGVGVDGFSDKYDFDNSNMIDNTDVVLVYQNNGIKRNIKNSTEEG